VSEGQDLVSAVPPGRWRAEPADVLCRPDQDPKNRTWSDRGGYVTGFEDIWNPAGFAVAASDLDGLDPLFHWALHCAREALRDAGDKREGAVDRSRVSAVFGNLGFPSAGMTRYAEAVWQGQEPLPDPRNRFMAGGAAALLGEALGLGPGVMCLDTACASSLYAIKTACNQLQDGTSDLALAGAVNCADDLFIHVGFTALNAMSPTGSSRPFHASADGLVPAEGAAFVALKRLGDARRDGDHIHGVIRAVGLSNDGRGRGFLAPAKEGQRRALEQAYQVSGIRPSEVSLLECHATGTSVGDATEIHSTSAVYEGCQDVPMGSLKSNMGHLITAAGAAGLIKVLEAMSHGERPPTLHAEDSNPALDGSPFRLLHGREAWDCEGPRIAGVSAFGFGGNNAHLLVSEEHESIAAQEGTTAPLDQKLAIVAVGAIVGEAVGRDALCRTLLAGESLVRSQDGGSPQARTASVDLELGGLRFPPKDLQETLPQQLLLLAAAREAMTQVDSLPPTSTGVFVAMEPDVEVCRYGLRWRQAQRLRDQGIDPSQHEGWLQTTSDSIIPTLTSAGVVGTMPNIPANRLNSQLDLGGASFSVSAGEDSGLATLSLAARALRSGELDAAVVAAVDLSCQEVHGRALATLLPSAGPPGDAAVVLVLKRLADASSSGDNIVAVLDPGTHDETLATPLDLDSVLGRSWAAGDLRDLAAAALCISHRSHPDGSPWLEGEPAGQELHVAGTYQFTLSPHDAPRPALAVPQLHCFAAEDRAALLAELAAGNEGGVGPCRLVILASSPEQLVQRKAQSREHIERRTPAAPGIHFQERSVQGEMAFVFTGAGSAYGGMGRELLQALPELGDALSDLSAEARAALALPWAGERETPALQRLWSSSALSQLHALLSQKLLGLKPAAVIGYSSGESNSLFATGTWTDMDAMIRDAAESGLFSEAIGGEMRIVSEAWERPANWQTWTVLAPIAEVQPLVDQHEHLYLSVIHSEQDCIVAGDAEACASFVAAIGAQRCLRLHYDLAVHVPLLDAVREPWLQLHRRKVTPQAGLRIYSGGPGGSYEPSADACAEAILTQSNRTLDFRQVIESAWQDGVRIFVEHGPQGSCSRWIRDILGEREAVVVALDRKGRGLEPIMDTVAALLAAGHDFDPQALLSRLLPASQPTVASLQFAAHRPPIHDLPLPKRTPLQSETSMQTMPQAPALRPTTADGLSPAPAILPAAATPAPVATPLAAAAAPVAAETPATEPAEPRLEALRNQIITLGMAEQQHLAHQLELHQRFLALQEQSMAVMLAATTAIPAAPVSLPTPTPPQVAPPLPAPAQPIAQQPAAAPATSTAPLATEAPARATEAPARATEAAPEPTGPTFDLAQLKIHSSGTISEIYGEMFSVQDDYHRQVRMPEPPLLLADRVTGLDAVAGSMGKGTIWSESTVEADRWFMHQGHMPAGIMIESGQADLMLISYLGVDFSNRGERVYRLLGCELTYYGGLPAAGELLKYDIHMDGHATQGDVRLMFFHSDCRSDGEVRLSVRKGQAGFFTDAELAESDGCLWTPEEQELAPNPRLDPPHQLSTRSEFSHQDLRDFAGGRPWQCFGEGFELCRPHTRTPRIQGGPMLLLGDISDLDVSGGAWGRGYAKSTLEVTPDLWFFDGHFKHDPCMPGTLMFEGCLQLMAFYMSAMGFTIQRDGWRFEPVSDEPFALSCRGQVTPSSGVLTYELFVEEVHDGPVPTLYADLLCTVDGLKAFHARRIGLQLSPGWPLDEGSKLLEGYVEPKDVAHAGDFPFDYRSLVACANGRPSEAFGPIYERFDAPGRVARLPNPPYHFLSRVTRTRGAVGSMEQGMEVDVEYDIPVDAWYFEENGCRAMPFAVLLEAALQPCGWLASYMGCALTTDIELCFRNLDGTGTVLVDLLPDSGTLLTKVRSTNTSRTASMIIVSFDVQCSIDGVPVYEMDTVFGFFPQEALQNQIGLPTSDEQRAVLEAPGDRIIDLCRRPDGYWEADRPSLAEPMLLMLDRITMFDPKGGEAGLGVARGEKDVDPGEWFFKAHFFQDPVQPGSLGIEAMVQLLQWTMLETGLDEGIDNPRFETLGLGEPMTWKYRGQVVPTNKVISSTLEITEVRREEDSATALAKASLWVDGKRIYEASGLAMRIVSGGTPDADTFTLDPTTDTWLADHCPTWTVPALPMMSMVDLLAQGACSADPVTSLRDVRVTGWLDFPGPRTLRSRRNGERVRLLAIAADGSESEIASARVSTGEYPSRPQPISALSGEESELPYLCGELFHGPAFQLLKSLIRTSEGASSVIDASSVVPVGRLGPALLDAATHGIPHDHLQLWNEAMDPGKVAYPALITEMSFFGATPTSGTVRCEVRPDGFLGSNDFPAFSVQMITKDGVWCSFRLIESCFPKGSLGSAEPADRMAFLRDRRFVPGLSLSNVEDGATVLHDSTVQGVDWLPGTVAGIYGSRDPLEIARKEHIARAHELHPGMLPEGLPLHRFELESGSSDEGVRVSGDGLGSLDLSPLRDFWSPWFDRGPWPVEDLYYSLIARFVRRVVVTDPQAFAALRGRSLLYLGNHQVGVESLLFSIIASALGDVPTVTLAKEEHRTTWLGRLIEHCFTYPGVEDPKVITFFDREDKASLPAILGELAAEMSGPGRSVMVHIEGTRSLDCTTKVEKMSGAFLDMAMAVDAPVVPIRFVGGLPRQTLQKRLEFPIGMGQQDIWIGRPILPEQLQNMHYGERKRLVIDSINSLGPAPDDEQPLAGDAGFDAKVRTWQEAHGVSHEHAVLAEVLAEIPEPTEEVARLLAAESSSSLNTGDSGPWLSELGRRLLGS
jgi:acyl transferase domain-containing protein/3-hydroxymyristoyl/3-hydroxydecanoyl-(acyl carrier protein) dehydratase